MRPNEDPVWGKVANHCSFMLKAVRGEVGLFMAYQQEDHAIAQVVLSRKDSTPMEILDGLREMRQRLEEVIEHVEKGGWDLSQNHQVFMRNEDTGEYFEQDYPYFED